MKILVALAGLDNKNAGRQPWSYVVSIARAASLSGHEVTLVSDGENLPGLGIRIATIKGFRSFPRGISREFRAHVAREKYDLVIWPAGITDFFFTEGIRSIAAPVIAVITSPVYRLSDILSLGAAVIGEFRLIPHFLLGTLLSERRTASFFGAANVRSVIFESEGTMERVLRREINKEIYLIHPSVSDKFLEALENGKSSVTRKRGASILYFGPPLSARGLDTLIRAVAIARKKEPRVELTVLSRTEDPFLSVREKAMRDIIEREGVSGHVEIVTGMLDARDIARRILAADIVALPFKIRVSDAPLAVLEALASGVPVITTDASGFSPKMFPGYWMSIVRENNPCELAACIVGILKGMGGNAKRAAPDPERFSFEVLRRKIEKVIGGVLSVR
ncbi:MAG: glycosyltransferase family 4 protein [Candidatus Omnitrophica bacterium]|nr:glycosyltransferase family 4 protein [Candidatus Omnitrophota bacterium]